MIKEKLKCAPKIVCTIGPASESEAQIRALIEAGMNIVRLNFSHGDHASHREKVARIRRIAAETGLGIGILQDLQGPKIRMGENIPEEGVALSMGDELVLSASKYRLPLEEALPVDYDFLSEDLEAGQIILFGDGQIIAAVSAVEGKKVICSVTRPGRLFRRKGVNMPQSSLQIPAMREKDLLDLNLGIELGIDFVALSFVRSPEDVQPILNVFRGLEQPPLLLAKIEKPQAIGCFDQILQKVDGIMVARGDLGVEMPMAELPSIQKHLIAEARSEGKFVITATQMLFSMMDAPLPTRAEVSDVANAMYDGTDAVMLSDETAAGRYPLEACRTMAEIGRATTPELQRMIQPHKSDSRENLGFSIGYSACTLARDNFARCIVVCTDSGETVRAVSRFRPVCPIVGLTHNPRTYHQLTVSWGVIPLMCDLVHSTDELFEQVQRTLTRWELVAPGDAVVITASTRLGVSGSSNLLHVLVV